MPNALAAALQSEAVPLKPAGMPAGMPAIKPVEKPALEDMTVEVPKSAIPMDVKEGDEVSFQVASIAGDMIQLVYAPTPAPEAMAEGEGPSAPTVAKAMDMAEKTI